MFLCFRRKYLLLFIARNWRSSSNSPVVGLIPELVNRIVAFPGFAKIVIVPFYITEYEPFKRANFKSQ